MNPCLILVTGLVGVASLAGVAAAGGVAGASQQVRAQQPSAPSGVTVQGRLVAAETSQPFRDATVILQPVTEAPAPPGLEAIAFAQPPPVPTGLAGGQPRLATYPPTCFPTALSVAEAGKLRVRPGEEIGSVDIVLQRSRLVTVRGVAVDANGSPAHR